MLFALYLDEVVYRFPYLFSLTKNRNYERR
jgi:hypothetical protein